MMKILVGIRRRVACQRTFPLSFGARRLSPNSLLELLLVGAFRPVDSVYVSVW